MYREKLISQITVLEDMQRRCTITDISELVELGENILSLAKKIDELNDNSTAETKINVEIDSKEIYKAARPMLEKCMAKRYSKSPKEVIEQAVKEVLEEALEKAIP